MSEPKRYDELRLYRFDDWQHAFMVTHVPWALCWLWALVWHPVCEMNDRQLLGRFPYRWERRQPSEETQP